MLTSIKMNSKLATIIVIGCLLSVANNIIASTIYVDDSATGLNNGTSWENAYTNLQESFDASKANDLILVTNGVYSLLTTVDKSILFST